MARCPIVKPDILRLPLRDGEFLDVKKELTAGEYRDMLAAQLRETDSGRLALDFHKVGMAKVVAFVVDWSFVDVDGSPLTVSEDVLRKIDLSTWQDILRVVDEHYEAWEAGVEARKNAQDGAIKPSPISPSVVSVA